MEAKVQFGATLVLRAAIRPTLLTSELMPGSRQGGEQSKSDPPCRDSEIN